MPLFDVAVINNLGKTAICYFAPLEKQMYENYVWALQEMKSQIKRSPQVIFSDYEEALTKDKLLLFFLNYF